MSPQRATVATVALRLHDMQCNGYNSADPHCLGESRADHARRTQMARANDLAASSTRDELARKLHDMTCPAHAEVRHGPFYADRAARICVTHVAAYRRSATLGDFATLLGLTQ